MNKNYKKIKFECSKVTDKLIDVKSFIIIIGHIKRISSTINTAVKESHKSPKSTSTKKGKICILLVIEYGLASYGTKLVF